MRAVPYLATILFLSVAGQSHAQAQTQAPIVPRTEAVTVRAGTPQKIAFYPAAKRDCTRTPLPEIRLLDEPRHGKLVVRRASIKAAADSACPGQTIPGQLVLFIAKPGYEGKDSALYAVRVADQDAQVRLDVRVTASPSPSGRMIDL